MVKDGIEYFVPNDKCKILAENGFVFHSAWIQLFKDGRELKKQASQVLGIDGQRKYITDYFLKRCDDGWLLAIDDISSAKHKYLKNQLQKQQYSEIQYPKHVQSQLSLNLDDSKKDIAKRTRAFFFYAVKKDSDPNVLVPTEELQEYLRNGYYILKDFVHLKKEYEAKTISMISSSSWVKTDEDKIAIRKIRSREILSYLDSGWKC
jgi:hypothetical protein